MQAAFNDVFCNGKKEVNEWSLTSFYLYRSLVNQFMPNVADFVQRQSSIRQLRLNLIPVIVLWFCAGIIWGIKLLIVQDRVWGIIVIFISTSFSCAIIFTLINRMADNEEREVREVQTAFLAGYSGGIFDKSQKGVNKQETPIHEMKNCSSSLAPSGGGEAE